ncbi:MAG: hypothetical protein J6C03_00030, partial [Clostridia bacterium]|nr:hypothetical protein [Clostridia bacterium]
MKKFISALLCASLLATQFVSVLAEDAPLVDNEEETVVETVVETAPAAVPMAYAIRSGEGSSFLYTLTSDGNFERSTLSATYNGVKTAASFINENYMNYLPFRAFGEQFGAKDITDAELLAQTEWAKYTPTYAVFEDYSAAMKDAQALIDEYETFLTEKPSKSEISKKQQEVFEKISELDLKGKRDAAVKEAAVTSVYAYKFIDGVFNLKITAYTCNFVSSSFVDSLTSSKELFDLNQYKDDKKKETNDNYNHFKFTIEDSITSTAHVLIGTSDNNKGTVFADVYEKPAEMSDASYNAMKDIPVLISRDGSSYLPIRILEIVFEMQIETIGDLIVIVPKAMPNKESIVKNVVERYNALAVPSYINYANFYVTEENGKKEPHFLQDTYCVNRFDDLLVYTQENDFQIALSELSNVDEPILLTGQDSILLSYYDNIIFDGFNLYGILLENKDSYTGNIFTAKLKADDENKYSLTDISILHNARGKAYSLISEGSYLYFINDTDSKLYRIKKTGSSPEVIPGVDNAFSYALYGNKVLYGDYDKNIKLISLSDKNGVLSVSSEILLDSENYYVRAITPGNATDLFYYISVDENDVDQLWRVTRDANNDIIKEQLTNFEDSPSMNNIVYINGDLFL